MHHHSWLSKYTFIFGHTGAGTQRCVILSKNSITKAHSQPEPLSTVPAQMENSSCDRLLLKEGHTGSPRNDPQALQQKGHKMHMNLLLIPLRYLIIHMQIPPNLETQIPKYFLSQAFQIRTPMSSQKEGCPRTARTQPPQNKACSGRASGIRAEEVVGTREMAEVKCFNCDPTAGELGTVSLNSCPVRNPASKTRTELL